MGKQFLDSIGLKELVLKIKELINNKADKNHTHNYAASNTAGGDALNADTVDGYHGNDLWRSNGAVWNAGANVVCSGAGEWSFDIQDTGATPGSAFWHVYSTNTASPILKCYPANNLTEICGDLNVYGGNSVFDDFTIRNNGSDNPEGGELRIQNQDGSLWYIDSCVNTFRIFDNQGHVHFAAYPGNEEASYFAGSSNKVDGWHVVLNDGWGLKPIAAGTGGMTSGVTGLSSGHIYLQYE